ncbi:MULTISPECIES: N-6 DNA methylase [Acidithiobacillus]|uniref:site-specific DNA-methyltransferase (adenine-specific) n=2 Tax=Acidithiobacillus TaxID=119977 RepID=A0A179BKY9_ACIFR|nr:MULTISPECIES: N-6 DNA methylase [Acidithiobacillus]MEB8485443.1 N-6 DNA methylase [Acidithiobacillus ferriphilus]MEB8491208.1 N-6 DNA methylase [Acidithiobacillus ferriphilus]MEB8491842.1 N-6 DNA methylase [Acidithiobacillus ferriphilus]MEB8515664.1 N-6 DNA methylase [Acidithiobacillus ferriphilus]MEB8522714.1 N-6 DNA methylase [Acidithiobacillus ferriphilus]
MLDTTTKRRIDTARDILVGKVPDPKSQVEQITIALIYKFMDDMDAESEELGGKRKFFTGDYARYGWAKLMAPSLGGHEMLGLYGEGIAKMPENPGIPALFRDIFKNAYLPYRDPETLKSFLKIIDEFSYDHSERLGDAFEYLLSVLGSQGDAGQFRTPRHIIDFMVEVLAPQKNETILDPACGTAGFLISAYKHILRANTDAKGHSTLTPDDKGRLAKNFKGYDISPDMVRLSLVNLYLHGFTDPHIFEYDTLTSEERWNEFADVILANPPFMSPKGGIKPHKRFSIQAKRSEVLFVDYMAEHLTPTGRAGIIVPEGIIFQSQGAYRELRKTLVENTLVAVVSLPAGCFNPYSGVKTSILILDKTLAKAADTIAFFKVENDGFGLGAQRRAIEKNDLPQVQAELAGYLQALRANASTETILALTSTAQIVPKEKIAANGDYNLSGERYREGVVQSTHFPWRTVESLVETVTPPAKIQKTAFGIAGRFPIIDQSQDAIAGWTDDESALIRPTKPLVIFGDHTCAIKLVEAPFAQGADGIKILQTIESLEPRFLFHVLRARPLESDGYQRHYSKLKEHQIPLPPLEVQKEIVAEIEGYQKVINGARAVLDHYRPHIPIHPDWPMVELGEACDVRDGTHDSPKYVLEGYPLITSKNLKNGFIDFTEVNLITREDLDAINKRSKVDAGDILMPMIGTIGNPVVADDSREYAVKNVALIKFPKGCQMDNRFLKDVLDSAAMQDRFNRQASGSTQKFIPLGFIRKLEIPLPPLATQQAIVAEIEAEQALVAANRELITRFEQKIQATLARIWGEEIPVASKSEDK